MSLLDWTILIIYASFAIDLLGIPVPSIASTQQLFFPENEARQKKEENNLLLKVRGWSIITKIFFLFLPSAIGMITYLLPLFVIVIPFLENIFGNFPTSYNSPFILIGVLLAILGRCLAIGAALNIRKNNSQSGKDFSLKTKNIFSFSRNPILLGLHLTFLGLLFLYPVKAMFIGGAIFVSNMHFRIILEEHFLMDKFGQPFEEYRKKTKRYF